MTGWKTTCRSRHHFDAEANIILMPKQMSLDAEDDIIALPKQTSFCKTLYFLFSQSLPLPSWSLERL
ncbi:MAG: hypothetical protein AAFQ23_08640 [Cyanobacteria bacterium J06623_1]